MTSGTSSSSTSGSTSTSGSSSCTDTGSSTDTDSSSSAAAEKSPTKSQQPPPRRKISNADNEKSKPGTSALVSTASKMRSVAAASNQRNGGGGISSDDDDDQVPVAKKTVRPTNTTARRKPSTSTAPKSATSGGNKSAPAPPPPPAAAAAGKSTARSATSRNTENGDAKRPSLSSSSNSTDDSKDKDVKNGRKMPLKMASTASAVRAKQMRAKMPVKQSNNTTATKNGGTAASRRRSKSSNGSDDSESGSGSGDDSSSMTDTDASDSSNSHSSQPSKNAKGKRPSAKLPRTDSDEDRKDTANPMRKLTRSLSMRRSKQQVKQQDSDSESDADLDDDKHPVSKASAKKPAPGVNNNTKCKVKKELGGGGGGLMPIKTRPVSPPAAQLEKKCPIEGCDSSGHLSGNLDRHFLPEACPIYHNMSASECKERANERKLRNEQRHKVPINIVTQPGTQHTNHKSLTPEQRDFLAKIRESRANFRPISTNSISDKVKLEKDCTDEDREPNLAGLVPDYDLQLFREAQALASEHIEDELKDLPVGKGIKYITMGKYKMKVWYQSPYPDDAARLPKMYICEFCLRYQKSETGIKRHAEKCVWRHPPGDEIYRKGKLQVWQVDGKRYKQYCQHLCLLAKFFLDHKTLYYDVEPFLFYIMTLADVDGCHIVGYFSKEKNSFYNVSCILTLPPYQRKGYGRLLIDFSYLLTRVEGKIGSPEKPLSDLGLISYRSYWKDVLLDHLYNRSGNTLSIKDVSQEMAIYSYDIVSTLQALGMMKYWKGKHIVLKKQDVLDEYDERVKRRGTFPKIDDSCLRWQPFVPTQPSASP